MLQTRLHDALKQQVILHGAGRLKIFSADALLPLTKNRNASIYRLTLRQAVGPTAVEALTRRMTK
jgi:hypothetical protein